LEPPLQAGGEYLGFKTGHPFILLSKRNRAASSYGVSKDKAVLDLGCGDGRHARLIKEMGASHVVGVDVNERMVELAKSKTGESDGVSFAVADGRDIPVEDNSTDIVFSNFVIHYFANAGEIFNPKYSPPACSGGSNW